MNMRRCEWVPLATQQLRLRNLTRIQGVNIQINSKDDEADANAYCHATNGSSAALETFVYFTLHETKESAPFYKSEALRCCFQQQKWAEIHCDEMLKSNANCVCVKVWVCIMNGEKTKLQKTESEERQEQKQKQLKKKDPISALSKELSITCLSPNNLPRPPDKLLFTWGVYFSGLILISQETETEFCRNSLLFQLNGYYFTSPESLSAESLREQLSLNYERYFTSITNSPPPIDKFAINSPPVSRSSSPVAIDWQHARFQQVYVPQSVLRKSYNLEQLLNLQELQRLRLQKRRESAEVETEIKFLSVHCITSEQLLRKPRTSSLSTGTSSYQHHSMGRALSILLAEQEQIDPNSLLRAQHLQRQIETLRCRKRLLTAEHETYKARIQTLRERLCSLTLMRQEQESWLRRKHEENEDENDELQERYQNHLELLQKKKHIMMNIERRMCTLCLELRGIYPIKQNQFGCFSICDISLPNLDLYLNDMRYMNTQYLETISANALSAALGFLAHLTQMIAIIVNRPLRNPIKLEGSRSRISDIIKDIPYGSREFPLFTRSSIPAKPVKYAIYLLNQNIAQLCYDITGTRCDFHATIENILYIFTTLAEYEQSRRDMYKSTHKTRPNRRLNLHSNNFIKIDNNCLNVRTNDSTDGLSKSHSSNDMNHMTLPQVATSEGSCDMTSLLELPPSSQPVSMTERTSTVPRSCRSVGSYSDCEDDFKDIIEQNYSNSDSNIQFHTGC